QDFRIAPHSQRATAGENQRVRTIIAHLLSQTSVGRTTEGTNHSFDLVPWNSGGHNEAEVPRSPLKQLHSIAVDSGALLSADSRCTCALTCRSNIKPSWLLEYAQFFPMPSEDQPNAFASGCLIPNHPSQDHAWREPTGITNRKR